MASRCLVVADATNLRDGDLSVGVSTSGSSRWMCSASATYSADLASIVASEAQRVASELRKVLTHRSGAADVFAKRTPTF